ncbi:retinol dehydrogenase 14-like [Branchiostoma lanceolatum]|uniref:retinol dehydrogenase 14-like n=1 Tax=Branchiostoma lanceolatum TaxID=7740 RepID=UPI003453B603
MAPPKCLSQASLKDKTAIVTGANTGIGFEVAKDLARRGAKVILACRNEARAEAAVAEIVKDTGNENVMTSKLDLASLSSVREFSQKMKEGETRLDILVNNAGEVLCFFVCTGKNTIFAKTFVLRVTGMFTEKSTTEDGFDTMLQVNHLGHFLLTNLLLDLLKTSAPSRVVVVSSDAYKSGRINFEDINAEKSYDAFPAYAQGKLANVLFIRELARRLEGTGVTTYAVHPGFVKTEIWRYIPGMYGWKFTVMKPMFRLMMAAFSRTPEQGAQTVIHCAVEEKLSSESGLYYSDCDVKQTSQKATDDAVARQLWELSERMTGLSSL